MKGDKTHYRRNLPHMQPKNGVFNLCFRLYGSLPKAVIEELRALHHRKKEKLKHSYTDEEELKNALRRERDLYYGKFDALLDNPKSGPTFLANPKVAEIVAEGIMHRHKNSQYKLIQHTIMPNHVHMICYKIQRPLFRILQSLKANTGTKSNVFLDRVGETFWHNETYDNLIHSRSELARKIQYNLNNPTKAGLCRSWKDWPFSFLNPEFEKYAPT